MNWIKNNPFVSALAGITLVLCVALFFLGSKGGGKYDAAKMSFDESMAAVANSESITLYPEPALRDGKIKALGEYRESIDDLGTLFDGYRPGDLENISPQDFTAALKAANQEVTAALEAAGCEVPDGFLMGFERYGNEFATEQATGILKYQLNGVKHALLKLAENRPGQLVSFYREVIPEETGSQPELDPNSVSRPFAYEIAFKASESSVRGFLNALGETEPYYYIVRCLKIANERDTPPKVSDSQFEKTSALEPAPAVPDNPFGDAFVLPGDEVPAPEETPAPAPGVTAAATPEPAASTDSSRILAQVLGSEELLVFVRFDLTMFLPSKELPKP